MKPLSLNNAIKIIHEIDDEILERISSVRSVRKGVKQTQRSYLVAKSRINDLLDDIRKEGLKEITFA